MYILKKIIYTHIYIIYINCMFQNKKFIFFVYIKIIIALWQLQTVAMALARQTEFFRK